MVGIFGAVRIYLARGAYLFDLIIMVIIYASFVDFKGIFEVCLTLFALFLASSPLSLLI